ncbi:MAG TPA: esterase-like activity of phytase family protein [Stenotrophomonas sp.]|nr:esterase-like activity of phytase family protein [Stenotrophomonas sp.]
MNHGLVATGTLPAATLDFLGDTLGSFSSLAVARGSWRRVEGGYEGTLWTLPDRGRNDPDAGVFFDYPTRLQRMHLRIADGQVQLSPQGGMELRDFEDRPFTGADPGSSTRVQRGHVLPSAGSGVGAGKISLDAEALAFTADGHFYIGDEYAANVYYFDAQGHLQGVIEPPAAIVPRRDGEPAFGSLKAPRQGRRNNQGVEGMALSPDGRRLFVALQSALVQDTAAGDASGRINARVLVYDVSGDPLPRAPIGHYVVQLPAFRHEGGSGPADRTAAQSELRALDDHRLLLLARDSNGLGADDGDRPVFKQVLLVDIAHATNLAGSEYEQTAASVLASAQGSSLRDGIEAAAVTPLIDMLVPSQLARFGLGLERDDPHLALLSEKWESMDLVPALDPEHPRDWFLLVGNDNDFIARHCLMRGQRCDSRFDNDNRLLLYRLTLPAH